MALALKKVIRAPNVWTKNISCIDFAKLRAVGIRGVIFDKDNTLTLPYGVSPHPIVAKSLAESAKVFGKCAAVLSNSMGRLDRPHEMKSADLFERQYGVRVLRPLKRKPLDLQIIQNFAKDCGSTPPDICIIGDRLFTDVVLANLSGCMSILTDPLITDPKQKVINQLIRFEHWLAPKLPRPKAGKDLSGAVTVNYLNNI